MTKKQLISFLSLIHLSGVLYPAVQRFVPLVCFLHSSRRVSACRVCQTGGNPFFWWSTLKYLKFFWLFLTILIFFVQEKRKNQRYYDNCKFAASNWKRHSRFIYIYNVINTHIKQQCCLPISREMSKMHQLITNVISSVKCIQQSV